MVAFLSLLTKASSILRYIFSQYFLDTLSFNFENLSVLSIQMPSHLLFKGCGSFCSRAVFSLSWRWRCLFDSFITQCKFEMEIAVALKSRESQALLSQLFRWKMLNKDVIRLVFIFLPGQIHDPTRLPSVDVG